jgi:hypothetical protein
MAAARPVSTVHRVADRFPVSGPKTGGAGAVMQDARRRHAPRYADVCPNRQLPNPQLAARSVKNFS